MEWLVIWGASSIAWSVFRPILDELAKEVAKDVSKSYVADCFKSVFSIIHRDPLTKATGQALKELLELIENELLDAGLSREQLQDWVDDVDRFIKHPKIKESIASLFLDPDFHLDPKVFVSAWQSLPNAHTLPEDFSWQRIARRFARKISDLRQSTSELKETFASLAQAKSSEALKELAGLPPDFDIESYRIALLQRFANLSFESLDTTGAYYSSIRLWTVFVPQSVRECQEYYPQLLELPKEHQKRLLEKGEMDAKELAAAEKALDERRRVYFSQPLRPVLQVADDPSDPRLVILGDPGSGKSSLLRFLALRWARIEDANLRYTQPLPLLIELRDYNRWECKSGKSFVRYLHEASNWHRLNQQTLDHLLRQPGRVILLLDGLDEVFDPAQRDEVLNDIQRFSNQYSATPMILTSRVVGYQASRLRDAQFSHFMLQDLDRDQITTFLKNWHDVTFTDRDDARLKQARLQRAVNDSKSIAMLAGNPLLLTMMAILNRNQELPRDRAELYYLASRVLLHQWDTERLLKDFPGLGAELGFREKTAILRRVAFQMQSGPKGLAGNIIDGDTLTNVIETYLRDELHFTQPMAIARAVIEQLRTRNFILCFLGADTYAFVHRTFLEYFCAAEYVHRFHVERTMPEADLIALFEKYCRDDDWREVLRLICCQIDDSFIALIIERLSSRAKVRSNDGRTAPLELLLAVGCLSETRNKSKLSSAGGMLFDSILALFQTRFAVQLEKPFLEELLFAVDLVGPAWPGKKSVDVCERLPSTESWSHVYWPKFVGASFNDRSQILAMATSSQYALRWGAVETLAGKWPDETTRKFLSERAVQDQDEDVRQAAIRSLAEKWPDETTRKFLIERAVQDQDEDVRQAAIRSLAEKWPDETTRKFLIERAVQDENYSVRQAAIQSLAEKWPDETTRKLLTQRAVQDENYSVRQAAIRSLAEKWPDETTRKLLSERAVQNQKEDVRQAAIQSLAEKWPDETTRKLLIERAVQDEHYSVRQAAIQSLAEKWPDETTRKLLTQRAVQDQKEDVRRTAIRSLAEKWPDKTTRKLLFERVLQDQNDDVQATVLETIIDNFPGEATEKLTNARSRRFGVAAFHFAALHSEFGRCVFTLDADGLRPYLDPSTAISPEHISKAAKTANLPSSDIPQAIISLSKHMGWDITKGSKSKT